MYLIAVIAGFLIGGIVFVTRHPLGGALFGSLLAYFIYRTAKLASRVEDLEERLRLYSRDDLNTLFASAGLSIVEVFGDYAGHSFVDGVSERVIIIAEK